MRPGLSNIRLRDMYDHVATRYNVQHTLGTLRSDQRGRRLVVKLAVQPGDVVLDAGGGTGSTAILAARAAGPHGRVVLLDSSAGMLAVAGPRIRAAGLETRISLERGDIMSLPFRTGVFDAVLSTYSVCPLYDPGTGAVELYRVVKPGGFLGIAHSAEPHPGLAGRLAERWEDFVWRWPSLSLGCRPVSVLPQLGAHGAVTVFERRIGIPLWPFLVLVATKPRAVADSAA